MTRFELFRRNLWLMVRRSGSDARARRGLLVIVLVLLFFAGYGLLLRQEYRDSGVWGIAFSGGAILLAIGLGAFLRKRSRADESSSLKLSEYRAPEVKDLSAHRTTLVSLLLRTAVLVDRAGNEALHHQSKADPAHGGICRRRTLDVARKPELWETFTTEEQELLLSQEGSWPWEQVWSRIVQVEDVRTLRWVLQIDEILTPFEFLTPDLSPAIELTLKPERVEGKTVIEPYDLRTDQTVAQGMVIRCVGEGIRRGILTEENDELRAQYLELAERMADDESADLLIGAATVAKADKEKIQWVAQAAIRRLRVLTVVIDYLNGPADAALTVT